ncbi:MAG: FAD-binding oxidoreductase [Verrucomicrobia bacterium]|nr:FAD-binding oxidoreductase [Verrucomicrobiota bacterium]
MKTDSELTVNAGFAANSDNRRQAANISRDNASRGAALLAKELRAAISGEVRFDPGSRALYSTDSSNYRQVPIGVVLPKTKEDVINTIKICHRHEAPITGRGCGTSLAGQCCNIAVVIDFSKYLHHLIELDAGRRTARVEPGIIYDDVNRAAKPHKLAFGPDPSTHSHCTIGGMIGNNSCGVHSVMAAFAGTGARTSDNIEDMEIMTYDGLRMRVGPTSDPDLEQMIRQGGRRGEIYRGLRDIRDRYADLIRARFPKIPRRVSGYNLDELLPEKGFNVARALCGTESTCVTVLEATLQLIPSPPVRSLVVLGYPDVYVAGDHIPEILEHKPVGLEGIDDVLIDGMKKKHLHPKDFELLPEGKGWLLVEFGGDTKEESDLKANSLMTALTKRKNSPAMRLYDAPFTEKDIWDIRESGLGGSARIPGEPDAWEGWEDSAVPPEKLGGYLREFRSLLQRYDYGCTLYGHFGQGVVHTRINFGLKDRKGVEAYERFGHDAAKLVVKYGGSLSGEHGDGQSRGELLSIMFGEDLVNAFREFKRIWDPDWKMNPGKVVNPHRRDENLRLGESYNPPQWKTVFKFPDDNGSFSYAMERCVGVGKCRRMEAGTMCPSYMATREEMHSTRGRARLLFELLQGSPIGKNGWRDDHVKEALDLCLSCKGCKSDCPMNVDMATYRAEFLSHYYAGRIRPAAAYSMGLIFWWSRLASNFPQVANLVVHLPLLGRGLKRLAGISAQRELPFFANETFRHWFLNRHSLTTGKRVILWPDTFNNYFTPSTARAAVRVLEAAGFSVVIPRRPLCCGRPLYDFGFLQLAKSLLQEILTALRDEIRAGTPIVGLEPSCVTVFRDELINLFPNDEDAIRLKNQTFLFSEFLQKQARDFNLPHLHRPAIVHAHCHHASVIKLTDEEAILKRLGLDYRFLDSGCCGMAGAFGYENGKYEVSLQCGERVLLPEVRKAAKDTLIISDGFSCREQIEQLTDRGALHLAEVIEMAMDEGPDGPPGNYPEKKVLTQPKFSTPDKRLRIVLLGALAVAAGVSWIAITRGKRR